MNLRPLSIHTYSFVMIVLMCLVAGCGMREVRFVVHEPSRISLKSIHTLALLDFGTPYSAEKYGEAFSTQLINLLLENGSPQVLARDRVRSVLTEMRIAASQLEDPKVVLDIGTRLNADAVLYGDVQNATLRRSSEREWISQKIGERRELVREVGANGMAHTVEYRFPVYEERWRDHIRRVFNIQVKARLVNASNNSIIWQGAAQWTGESSAEEDQDGKRRGDWTSDDEFETKQIHSAARKMFHEILPQALLRVRVLAEPEHEGPYFEWIHLGNDAALAGDWNQAGSHWLKASLLESARPEARGNLGILREHEGDFEQALRDYEFAALRKKQPWERYAQEVRQMIENMK